MLNKLETTGAAICLTEKSLGQPIPLLHDDTAIASVPSSMVVYMIFLIPLVFMI